MTLRVSSTTIAFAVMVHFSAALGVAQQPQWGQWRGPYANGTTTDATPPIAWSESNNIKWKVELAGKGSSTPVVWGDMIFLTTAIGGGPAKPAETSAQEDPPGRRRGRRRQRVAATPQEFVVLCLDRKDGSTIWKKTAMAATPDFGIHPHNTFASASPITDGQSVYAHFGSQGLYAFDLEGKPLWSRTDFGEMETRGGFGEGSSPFLYQDYLVVPWDHEGPSWIMVIDKKTGETIWRAERDEPSNWATPLVVSADGKALVVHSGANMARGYDLATGNEVWTATGLTQRPVSSPVATDQLVFFSSARGGPFLGAFRFGMTGHLNDNDGIAWTIDRSTSDIPSLLLSGQRLYYMNTNSGVISCANATTGEHYFQSKRLPDIDNVYSSPVAANGYVFVTGRDGHTVVLRDSEDFEVVATNAVDDHVDASVAIVNDEILLRGSQRLYCIAE